MFPKSPKQTQLGNGPATETQTDDDPDLIRGLGCIKGRDRQSHKLRATNIAQPAPIYGIETEYILLSIYLADLPKAYQSQQSPAGEARHSLRISTVVQLQVIASETSKKPPQTQLGSGWQQREWI